MLGAAPPIENIDTTLRASAGHSICHVLGITDIADFAVMSHERSCSIDIFMKCTILASLHISIDTLNENALFCCEPTFNYREALVFILRLMTLHDAARPQEARAFSRDFALCFKCEIMRAEASRFSHHFSLTHLYDYIPAYIKMRRHYLSCHRRQRWLRGAPRLMRRRRASQNTLMPIHLYRHTIILRRSHFERWHLLLRRGVIGWFRYCAIYGPNRLMLCLVFATFLATRLMPTRQRRIIWLWFISDYTYILIYKELHVYLHFIIGVISLHFYVIGACYDILTSSQLSRWWWDTCHTIFTD